MVNDEVGVAVVGCGYWGPNLLRNFKTLPGCTVTMICDLDTGQLNRMKTSYPEIRATTRFEEIIDDPQTDAVVIATGVGSHYDLARRSLLAGKHTFIEKPMATSLQQCRNILETATQKGLTTMVGHTFIYSAPVRKIKEIVDSGEIGELLYVSSQRLNLGLFQKDINVTWDLAPHDISILLYVMGVAPVAVNCQGKAHLTAGIEDVTNMSLEFPNGRFATILNSWLDPNKIRRMTFVGSRKMILYDDIEPLEKIKIYDKRVTMPPKYDSFGEFHYSYHYGDMWAPYLKQQEPLKVECQHFLDCIRNGSRPESNGEAGLEVVKILEAASLSLKREGGRISLT